MRNLIGISVVSSLLVGLLLAGCGGDDSAGSESIDKATFIEQANKICEQASGKLSAKVTSISSRRSNNSAETQVTLVEDGLIPHLEEELRQLRALGVPEDAKTEVEALFDAYRKAIELTKEKVRIVALTERLAPHESVAVAGTRFGVTECPISPVDANSGGAN